VESEEQALIDRAKAGDPDAYESLLEAAVRPATRLAFAMLHDRQEAEDAFGLVVGDGPVYLVSNDTPILTDWGFWATYKFVYAARVQGLVLIRARDLESNQPVVFAKNPLGPSGITAAGRVLGTDHLLNRTVPMYSEAVLQDPAHTAPVDEHGTLPPLTVMLGLQKGGSGCIGLQIDGPNFTETLVIRLSGYGI
jgi:hypothetical protein